MTALSLPPIAGAEIWSAVLSVASQGQDAPRCQCQGACGQPHIKAGGRCPRRHGQYTKSAGTVRLAAAPLDPLIEGAAAAALSPEDLRAWCPSCFDGARRAAARQADAVADEVLSTMEGLF